MCVELITTCDSYGVLSCRVSLITNCIFTVLNESLVLWQKMLTVLSYACMERYGDSCRRYCCYSEEGSGPTTHQNFGTF